MNTFTGSKVFKIDPLVRIDIKPVKYTPLVPSALPMAED